MTPLIKGQYSAISPISKNISLSLAGQTYTHTHTRVSLTCFTLSPAANPVLSFHVSDPPPGDALASLLPDEPLQEPAALAL